MFLDAKKSRPQPGSTGICPSCDEELIAKCGDIVIWHWAHKTTSDCDKWSEPMTEWHLQWQENFPDERREITIGNHRADAMCNNGTIVEFQHSPISPKEVAKREAFYGDMIWILDAQPHNFEFTTEWTDRNNKEWASVWWKGKRLDSWFFRKPVFIDFGVDDGGYLLRVEEVHGETRFQFKATYWYHEQFDKRFHKVGKPKTPEEQAEIILAEQERLDAISKNISPSMIQNFRNSFKAFPNYIDNWAWGNGYEDGSLPFIKFL